MRFALMVGLVMILTAVAAVEAQTSRAPRGSFDVALVGAQPTGDFGLIVDEGWGLELGGRYELDSTGLLTADRGQFGAAWASSTTGARRSGFVASTAVG